MGVSMSPEMGVVPPGGVYKFIQKLPTGTRLFVDVTEENLALQVIKFRINNGIPVGDVRTEISKSKPSVRPPGDQRSLRERVTGWKSNRMFQKIEFVEQDVADARSKVCLSCPYNKIKYYDDCVECYSHTARDLYAMRQGRETPSDQWLGACDICGHDNLTAVHLDEKNLLHRNGFLDELANKNPSCWMLHLDKEQAKEVA